MAEGFTGEGSMVGDSTAAISAGIATLSEVTTAGMAVATAITGTEAVGMVALTTAADIGMEARIGGITQSVSGTMTTITNRIGQARKANPCNLLIRVSGMMPSSASSLSRDRVLGLSPEALKGAPLTRRPGNHVSECRCPFRVRHIKTRFPG